ncbi:MAG: hypothetical protein V1736_02455 [Pseudomonadota bacterium]
MLHEIIPELSGLVDFERPEDVHREVRAIILLMFPEFDFVVFDTAFEDALRLFRGEYPGYQGCNTLYHDLEHTTDALLAMARLMHGAFVDGTRLGGREVNLGLISALMHDTGYIQRVDERSGTGAQYTLVHIRRSAEFMNQYFTERGYSREDFIFCADLLRCTGLETKIAQIRFESPEHEIVGKMLGTADLLGQMADRQYLKKLGFLYNEFREGMVPGFADELDLLEKTPAFYEFTVRRFAGELSAVYRYMRGHFRVRWNTDRDFYLDSIEKQIGSLRSAIKDCNARYNDREMTRMALTARLMESV